MKKLIQLYKGLPRELKTIIAMAGLGTPIGAIYALKRWIFPNTPTFLIILFVIGGVAVICLIAFLLAKFFGRGKKKRADKMAADLAGESGGPTSMDVGAAIKENNEKFFNAVKDMRKNIGLSVYDLPWYIIIGDSGCGKTKLINEGGLQFPAGKPEGYQLGTLNYNWWFTEDAIFIDMAGRLVNPRDDADRREWEAFLNTVGRGRKGYPINGAVVCVSADHLLADPPEKIEQDANTTLERLRDLQTKLGVTFATYLVITKCDKIVGFMQFFDRAERDIRVLNQMVGWSKPGQFNELYDPDKFSGDFEDIYRRLYDLRLRRLNDDADEIDLGLAYCFPEEFRELKEPLSTYIRTLFPSIKRPRVIKNLLFRGVYFTSATREGGLILKHLTERLGPEAAEQFQPLDLYPSKRPYFIRDLFFRKMFPEHGLVFRNEQEAVRNRKLARFLMFGGIGSTLLMIALVVFLSMKFSDQISKPRELANNDASVLADPPPQVPEAVETSGLLQGHSESLSQSTLAWFLSFGVGTQEPVHNLNTIHAGLFDKHVLPAALEEISRGLRETELTPPRYGERESERALNYFGAFEEFVRWHGCKGESTWSDNLNQESFEKMLTILPEDDESLVINMEGFRVQAGHFFATLKKHDDWKSPARHLDGRTIPSIDTVSAAVDKVIAYLAPYATLDENHPNKIIAEWMRIHNNLKKVDDSFQEMLKFADTQPQTTQDMENLKQTYNEKYVIFAKALDDVNWNTDIRFGELYDELLKSRQETWIKRAQDLENALKACGLPESDRAYAEIRSIKEAVAGMDRARGLDEILWAQLANAGLARKTYASGIFDDAEMFAKALYEVGSRYQHIVTLDKTDPSGKVSLDVTDDAKAVKDALKKINAALADAIFDATVPVENLRAYLQKTSNEEICLDEPESARLPKTIQAEEWAPDQLAELYGLYPAWIARGRCGAHLERLRNSLTSPGLLGIAHLGSEPTKWIYGRHYTIAPVAFDEPAARDPARRDPDATEPKSGKRKFTLDEAPSEPAPTTTTRTPAVQEDQGGKDQAPNWATPNFLLRIAKDVKKAREFLDVYVEPRAYLQPIGEEDLRTTSFDLLQSRSDAYFDLYFSTWVAAYRQKSLEELQRFVSGARDWPSFHATLSQQGQIQNILAELGALEEILDAVPFSLFDFNRDRLRFDIEPPNRHWIAPDLKQRALNSHWRDFPSFSQGAAHPNPNEKPSVLIGNDFKEKFGAFAFSLEKLPQRFPQPDQLDARPPSISINWPDFRGMRQQYSLTDEKLTAQLENFETVVQDYLSSAVDDVLRAIQSDSFGGSSTAFGWPFLDATQNYGNLQIRKTVDFQAFLRFLNRVRLAATYFKQLEDNLPSSQAKSNRATFYQSCREWNVFLGSEQGRAATRPLKLQQFNWFDPRTRGFNQVQFKGANFWGKTELSFGLEIQDEATIRFDNRTVPTPKTWNAKWGWQARQQEMFVKLIEGRPVAPGGQAYPELRRSLGPSSPLWLCSLLYAGSAVKGDRRTWQIVYWFDAVNAMQQDGHGAIAEAHVKKALGRTYGLGIDIVLESEMPAPIKMIR